MLNSIPIINITPSTPPMIMPCGSELSATIGMSCVELSVDDMPGISFSVTGLFSIRDVVVELVEYESFMIVSVIVSLSVVDLLVVTEDLIEVVLGSLLGVIGV